MDKAERFSKHKEPKKVSALNSLEENFIEINIQLINSILSND